jgi:5-formyltetrahydrofolate cyclo-ligase
MGEKKENLRVVALLQRRSLSSAEAMLRSRQIQERALHYPPYIASSAVAIYSPVENEVSTELIREHALTTGKKLFYPKSGGGTNFDMVRVQTPAGLAPGRHGILEPTGDQIMTRQDHDGLVIFVPGLAFDLRGNRLGRGGGWYDRLLVGFNEGVRRVALAYEFQIKEELPAETWDCKVDHVITEGRIIDCREIPSKSDWIS